MKKSFADRQEAGRVLAEKLKKYKGKAGTAVLGLARGGVVVAYEVAHALGLPMDVFVVRKLGLPGHEELAVGAIATGGVCVINDEVVRQVHLSNETINRIIEHEAVELDRRECLYREGVPLDVEGKTVILVDDGLATGATMSAAVRALRKRGAKKLVMAVPVGARETCEAFKKEVDEAICAVEPEPFYAVGAWYEDFHAVTDEEVRELLNRTAHSVSA